MLEKTIANITVSKAKLVSIVSEGVVIEGNNKVFLNDCTLVDSNTSLNGQSTTYKSGDAASGKSEFSSKNSSITTKKGDSFYVTNTNSYIS